MRNTITLLAIVATISSANAQFSSDTTIITSYLSGCDYHRNDVLIVVKNDTNRMCYFKENIPFKANRFIKIDSSFSPVNIDQFQYQRVVDFTIRLKKKILSNDSCSRNFNSGIGLIINTKDTSFIQIVSKNIM